MGSSDIIYSCINSGYQASLQPCSCISSGYCAPPCLFMKECKYIDYLSSLGKDGILDLSL